MVKDQKMNRMGSEKISRLILKMGIPMILSMVLQAVYNIVDSAFVSNMQGVGEQALNALTLAFPVQMLIVAVGIGTGVGANALLSRLLGMNNREKANRTAGNAVLLAAIIYIAVLLFGIFAAETYISSQSGNQVIVKMAVGYLRICCIFSFGMVFFSIYEKLLQATGLSVFSTIAQVAGAVTNIVFDPIMIYGLLGCPQFGVEGAAYATVIGQIVSFLLALIFHITKNKEISNNPKYLKPSIRLIGEIYAVGLPAIIAQALMSVMTYAMNIILIANGENYVTAYGLFYKIQQFILFAAFGLRDAITPIVSFNFGMRSKPRVKEGVKYGLYYTTGIMIAGFVLVEALAQPLSSMFGLSGETQELCISAMRIIAISFVFAGINIALQGIFQALQSGIESLAVSVCRQVLFVLPTAYALVQAVLSMNGANGWLVWLSFPVAEILSAAVAALMMKRIYMKKVAPIEE
ncbi:MAG: MATE family efflux transporter [Acutalibacteraceae bacterium]